VTIANFSFNPQSASRNTLVAKVLERAEPKSELTNVPMHVAIIMDGNGRWAQARGLPRLMGHRQGTENIRRVLRACVDFGVKVLTIYAFSTENWERPDDGVRGLMRLRTNTTVSNTTLITALTNGG